MEIEGGGILRSHASCEWWLHQAWLANFIRLVQRSSRRQRSATCLAQLQEAEGPGPSLLPQFPHRGPPAADSPVIDSVGSAVASGRQRE